MQLEYKVLRKVLLVAPDYPSNTDVRKSIFVSRSVDRDNTRETEIPSELRLEGGIYLKALLNKG